MKIEEKFMRRALQLARNGEGRVSPNPMVGAVITHGSRIIGEGFHAFYGGPHAEVNAIRSVKEEDKHFLKDSTIYVTLEPCAHHGKTPPCANLIVETGITQVVIGAPDPNPLVAGKGVKILKDAGIEVIEYVMKQECLDINRRFMFAQQSERPFIQLKWAQSADGFMAGIGEDGIAYPVKFSNALSTVWMHRERSKADAIMIGGNTHRIDNPRLDVRCWGGNSPKKFVARCDIDIEAQVKHMRREGITSLMVEGGAQLLNCFINKGLWDEIRIETSHQLLHHGLKAPILPENAVLYDSFACQGNIIAIYGNSKSQHQSKKC